MTTGPCHKRQRLQEFERLLRARGLPITIQRRTVLEVLLEGEDHATADEVQGRVQRRLPGLSRTTVYRVLDKLVELDVISKIYQPAAPAIYDTGTYPHHHLACLSCDKIVDLENHLPSAPVLPDTRIHGFEISESHVFFRGTCRECIRKRDKPRAGPRSSLKGTGTKSLKRKAKTHSANRSKRKGS